MRNPQISVLMPVYNAAEYLAASINSIISQTFSDWEMVIVNDGSTDGSLNIANSWTARDQRIRVIDNAENKGQTACLNQGMKHCLGTWIARQDADDLSHPQRFQRQIEYLRNHPETVLLGTQGVLIDGDSLRIGLLDVPEDVASVAWCLPFLNPFLHTAVLFHREIVLEDGGYDESYRIAQDYELWTRLAARHTTANIPQRFVSYRHSETSLSKTGYELAFAEADLVSEREVRRWLGRSWHTDEKLLVSAFRQGSASGVRRPFWRMINSLERESSQPLPPKLRASWHLKMAGSGGIVHPDQILAALRAAPRFSLGWLCSRFSNS